MKLTTYEEIQRAFRAIANTQDGERLIHYLIDEYLLSVPKHEPNEALFQNGQRDVVATLLNMLKEQEEFVYERVSSTSSSAD